MAKVTVGSVVRSILPAGMWQPGQSKIYNDSRLSLTAKSTRYNFAYLRDMHLMSRQRNKNAKKIIDALKGAGIEGITDVFVYDHGIHVYQKIPHKLG